MPEVPQPGSVLVTAAAETVALTAAGFAAASAAVFGALRTASRRERKTEERDIGLVFLECTDLMAVSRLDGRIRQSNPAWTGMLGYSQAQLADVGLLDLVHPDDKDMAVSAVAKLHSSPASCPLLVRMVDSSGGYRWVYWTITAPPGEPVLIWSGKDVTAMKEARISLEQYASGLRSENESVNAQLRQLRESSDIKSSLLAQTSHEIRTPMNGVLGMTELLLTTPLDNEQKEYAETIRQSAESLITILNGLLEYSRLEAKQAQFEAVPFDPVAVAAGVRLLFSARAHQAKVTLTSDFSPDIPRSLSGDPHRLRQILINLVSNAVKFTRAGTVHLTVEPVNRDPGSVVLRFAVKDTGVGIEPDQLPRLFQPFAQANSSIKRQFGGTGLGLAICKQLVESLGGQLGVESQPGVGSRFWFTLPFQVRAGEPVPMPVPVAPGRKRVLVVEDNPLNQNLARHLLEKEGCLVQIEGNGRAAVEAVMRRQFDLILMDIQMPEMDGVTATELIRKTEKGHRTAIVAVTGGGPRADREQCLSAGMDDYVSKPLTRDTLQSLLRRWAGRVEEPEPVGAASKR
ncbi:MAG: response regulator [Acidobacteria bacterium]|nr:response regulator [Acidobacteriota bacterium]